MNKFIIDVYNFFYIITLLFMLCKGGELYE